MSYPNVGKYGPEKTPCPDTFHAVKFFSEIKHVLQGCSV